MGVDRGADRRVDAPVVGEGRTRNRIRVIASPGVSECGRHQRERERAENRRDDRAPDEKSNRVTHVAPPSSSTTDTPYRSKIYSCKEQMSTRSPTTTSYAILGLLAIRPWATYDLAKLMRRSLHFFWPRAESNLYAETKRLVDTGLAEARKEWNGDRKRTVYSITDRGRDALRDWLATPPAPARVESEAQLRLLYANYGSKDDLLATIQSIEDDAQSDDRPLRPARDRVRTRRRTLPRSHPRQRAPRVALDRAGARHRPLGTTVTRRCPSVGNDRDTRHRMGRQNDAARCA